jgi:triosephosphate isomerase (TIM)
MVYIVANFKSYKTENEAKIWLEEIRSAHLPTDKKIIICPPFTLLPLFKSYIQKHALTLFLGAQNLSQFEEGPFTGEENAKQVKEFADYVLVGHSERRTNFNETVDILAKKTHAAIKNNLNPIYLVQSEKEIIPDGVNIVAYEPVFAIGSGTPDTPENADEVSSVLKQKQDLEVLYGGSVNSENVKTFTSMPNISGVLVGGSSLSAQEFLKVVDNA